MLCGVSQYDISKLLFKQENTMIKIKLLQIRTKPCFELFGFS